MSVFDVKRPIKDPSFFSPREMYVDNRTSHEGGAHTDNTNAARTFIFNAPGVKTLIRALGAGRKLQGSRQEYLRWLGINATSGEVSVDLSNEVENLVATYRSIKADCVRFKDLVWIWILNLVTTITSYAMLSGRTLDTSSYPLMLEYIGTFHEEIRKPNPNNSVVVDLKESIQFKAKTKLRNISVMRAAAAEALKGLVAFEKIFEAHGVSMLSNAVSLTNQLVKEGNDMDSLEVKIKEAQDDIRYAQGKIDEKNEERLCTPNYMWVCPIGTAISIGTVVQTKNAREKLQAAMEKVRKLLDEYRSSMLVASRLQVNVTFISSQIQDLGTEIGPLVETIQNLLASWNDMETYLRSLLNLIDFEPESIPPMLLTTSQLQGIVNGWSDLTDHALIYVDILSLNEEPVPGTIQEYIEYLKLAIESDGVGKLDELD
ncbi:hypothetical protein E4U17_005140 [Claviceps sp. LM77 group G4]|nr:hypothetical protein E4U17_005140 [Claviceps sp. LM77 group G4]KAG6066460.1 hypothetical protein E4U33_005583 [Claviceps sp. LM78 group G4]KAG6075646.1 hypothetical protein E4U16_003265 [Claviceps sp. LM84 group G4]